MKKKLGICFFTVMLLTLVLILFACNTGSSQKPTEQNRAISSITADTSFLDELSYEIGKFDVGDVKIKVKYTDGTEEIIPVTEEMLTDESVLKLTQYGTHLMTVVYENFSTKFSVTLTTPTKNYRKITIYGGYISAINDKAVVSPKIPNKGESVTEIIDDGDVLTLRWIQEEGQYFTYWTANDAKIGDTSIISVEANSDMVYRAHSEPVVYTVSFFTNTIQSVSSKITNLLNETDIAGDDGKELQKDGFVFDGWTTDEITKEESESGYAKNRVEFPYNVTRNIKLYAVWIPQGLIYEELENGYSVSGFNGIIKQVDIPSHYLGKEVVAISETAFISEQAKKIIGISIPFTVSDIKYKAFAHCTHLQEITVAENSNSYTSNDGVLYDKNMTELIAYPSGKITAVYVLPINVNKVASYAFYDALVGGIELNSNITEVGDRAFDSVHIDYVDFAKVRPVGFNFSGNVIFNENLTYLYLTEATRYNFEDKTQINAVADKISTEETRTRIGVFKTTETDGFRSETLYRIITNEYFDTSDEVAEIIGVSREIVDSTLQIYLGGYDMKSIGKKSYNNCCYLTNVNFPKKTKLERICDGAFDNTPWIKTRSDNTISTDLILYKYLGSDKTYKLPTDIKKIAEGAFAENRNIEYIDTSDNAALECIDAYAFYNCENFKGFKCTPNPSGKGLFLKNAMTEISAYAFSGTKVSQIKLQSAAEIYEIDFAIIGDYAFANCKYLTYVEIAGKTTNIANTAFLNCFSLEEFVINEKNAVFEVYDGILYKKNDNGRYTLYTYPAGRIDTVFNPSEIKSYAMETEIDEKNYLNGVDYSIGTAVFNGISYPVYMVTKNSVSELEGKENDGKLIFKYGKNYLKETTEISIETDGTISYNGDKYYFCYFNDEKTILLYDEYKDNYYMNRILDVAIFEDYSLHYSNIASVCIPSTVDDIKKNAVKIPGLIYAEFKGTPVSTYADMFKDYEPEYIVFDVKVSQTAAVSEFYGRNEELILNKTQLQPNHIFFYNINTEDNKIDKSIVYGVKGATLFLVKTSRTLTHINIPDTITFDNNDTFIQYKNDKTLLPYAFYGNYTQSVTLRKVGTLEDYVFSDAVNLTKLFIETGFINEVGEKTFGDKLNNSLYIYDDINDIDMYSSKWNLETFIYKNIDGEEIYTSKFLISTEKGAMAVIVYEDENGKEITLDILYSEINENEVENMQNMVGDTKPGYDIASWVDIEGHRVSLVNGIYEIPYNQILRCEWKPQSYVVYLTVSPSIKLNLETVSVGEDLSITYKTEVTYGESYGFPILENENNRLIYWVEGARSIRISNEGEQWLIDSKEDIYLNAVFAYKVNIELSEDYTVTLNEYEVYFGEKFEFEIPLQNNPEDTRNFIGWGIENEDGVFMLTDNFGKSINDWNLSEENIYTIVAIWE